MGAGWKNPIREANAAKKGKIISKFAKEIAVAAKLGGPDPATNARLRMVIAAAQEESMPKDTIERAIRKGAGLDQDSLTIEEVSYEGYGPHGVGVIVECHTDNRHRTAPEMRNLFKTYGGSLGEVGSVSWMFDRVSEIEARINKAVDAEEEAIEAGANEVRTRADGSHVFLGSPEDLDQLRSALQTRGWEIKGAELSYIPKTPTTLNEEQKKEVTEFLLELDDHDDTHRVHVTLLPD